MSTAAISVDEFEALEQKVLRAVEIVKREREARLAAEAEVAELRELLAVQASEAADSSSTVKSLEQERVEIRQRVEKMLHQMDELL